MIGSSAATISSVVSETPGLELGPVLGRGRELGADHEQLALEPDQELVELRATFALGSGEPERGDGFVDRAVRVGACSVLADAAAVQQRGRAVVTGARVHLACHRVAAESTAPPSLYPVADGCGPRTIS